MLVNKNKVIVPTYVFAQEDQWNKVYQDIAHIRLVELLEEDRKVSDRFRTLNREFKAMTRDFNRVNKDERDLKSFNSDLTQFQERLKKLFPTILNRDYRLADIESMSEIVLDTTKYKVIGDKEAVSYCSDKDYMMVLIKIQIQHYLYRTMFSNISNKLLYTRKIETRHNIILSIHNNILTYFNKSRPLYGAINSLSRELDLKALIAEEVDKHHMFVGNDNKEHIDNCFVHGYEGTCSPNNNCRCINTTARAIDEICKNVAEIVLLGITIV